MTLLDGVLATAYAVVGGFTWGVAVGSGRIQPGSEPEGLLMVVCWPITVIYWAGAAFGSLYKKDPARDALEAEVTRLRAELAERAGYRS